MILDSSAIIAILKGEPEGEEFVNLIESVEWCKVSAVTLVEVAVVARDSRSRDIDELVSRSNAHVVAFDAEQAGWARRAIAAYGRGTGHPAKLNFGDCMTYALAKVTGEPLLFKGDDFTHTDVTSARAQD